MFSFFGCGGGIWTSRPPGYEPDELPSCSTPRSRFEIMADGKWCRKPGSNRYEKKISRDFKSRASANSAIPAYGLPCCHIIIAQVVGFVKPFLWDFSFFRFPAGYLRLSSWHKRKNMIFYIRTCTCSICTFWANMCDVRSRKYAGLSKREQWVASPKTSGWRFWTRRNRPKQGAGRVETLRDDRQRLCDGGGQCLEKRFLLHEAHVLL